MELPKRLWVEATAASAALRDIELRLSCQGTDVEDRVRATGVWATVTAVAHDRLTARQLLGDPNDPNNNGDPEWNDMTNPPSNLIQQYDGTGLVPITAANGVRHAIAIKFTVAPPGVGDEMRPAFDGSRRKEAKTWTQDGADPCDLIQDVSFPAHCERANDDRNPADKSAALNADDEYFDFDAPGVADNTAFADLLIRRLNFQEFLRMRTDGMRPSGDLDGSRCSDFYDWHMRMRLSNNAAGLWVRVGGGPPETNDNDVAPGHIALGNCP